MQLTLEAEQPSFVYNASAATLAMANLVAPEAVESERLPLEVVAVVDRSGSMSGAKMKSMQDTLRFLVQAGLNMSDRLSIVTFDNNVDVPLGLTTMDAKGRKDALETIANLRTGGSTNLSGGLLKGIDVLQQGSGDYDATRAVLLFTDGIANHGITGNDAIISATQGAMRERVTLFTFGFGSDHQENMLRGLAETTSGLYYYIETSETIPTAFADCLGGLVSVVAQNVELVLQASPGVSRIALVHGSYAAQMENDGARVVVALGDMYAEDEKAILVQLELPAVAEAVEEPAFPTLKASCRYFSVALSSMVDTEAQLVIPRPSVAAAAAPVNLALDQQRTRILVAEAMDRAARLADGGDLAGGRELIEEAVNRAQSTPSASSELVSNLVSDLERVAEGYSSQNVWTSSGSKMCRMSAMSHQKQRSNHITAASYEKRGKAKMKASWMAPSTAESEPVDLLTPAPPPVNIQPSSAPAAAKTSLSMSQRLFGMPAVPEASTATDSSTPASKRRMSKK